jgi:hypothetical protein
LVDIYQQLPNINPKNQKGHAPTVTKQLPKKKKGHAPISNIQNEANEVNGVKVSPFPLKATEFFRG